MIYHDPATDAVIVAECHAIPLGSSFAVRHSEFCDGGYCDAAYQAEQLSRHTRSAASARCTTGAPGVVEP